MFSELPGKDDTVDEETEEDVAPSADGDGYILADISTPSAKLLTASLPRSTGEQTNHLLTPNSKMCVCVSIMLGRQLKGRCDVSFMNRPVAVSLSVNLSEDWEKQLSCIICPNPLITSNGRRKLLIQAVTLENF